MVDWFKNKSAGNFPVIGVVNEDKQLMGFATYGTFRAWPAYKYSVEHSIYIHKNHRDKGLGRQLMKKLISAASQQQYHTMIGGIDISNTDSVVFHEKLGFTHAGTIKEAAFKFNRWLDLGYYQLLLDTPTNPVDG
jgi:phosphinothricin acetyltransferase